MVCDESLVSGVRYSESLMNSTLKLETFPRNRFIAIGGELARWVLLGVVGLLITLLPEFRAGGEYLADGDELLYRSWSRDIVLTGSLSLVDATHQESGPMMHPWLLFGPPAWLCHTLGLGPASLGIVWRVIGGLGISAGLYTVLLSVVRSRWLAAFLAIFLICDAGLLFGQIGGRGLVIFWSLWNGSNSFFDDVPYVMAHLRVVPPALAIPLLFLHFATLLRARRTSNVASVVVAAMSLGILFHTYFYFWTVAVGSICLALMLDSAGRRTYARVLLGGLLIGVPAIISGMTIKSSTPPDWLQRTDKFVPIGRFAELIIPGKVLAVWLLTTPWVFLRRRELTYLWCFVAVGMAGLNSQVVTKLQIENFHWIQAMGLGMSILLASLVAPLIERRTDLRWRAVFGFILLVQVGLGLGLREIEGSQTTETQDLMDLQRRLSQESFVIPTGAILAGDRQTTLLVAASRQVYPLSGRLVDYCAKASDLELDQRLILNLFLTGVSRGEAEVMVQGPPGRLSREALAIRDPIAEQSQRKRRLELLHLVYRDPRPMLQEYMVDLVLLDQGATTQQLVELGERAYQGKQWDLWRLNPVSPNKP